MIPVYRTTLDAIIVPWSIVNSDLDDHDSRFPEAAGGLSTAANDFRRDLESWAMPFRSVVGSIVSKFMPYTGSASYNDYAKKSWFNRLGQSGYARYHNHIPCDLAIVWYINAPDNCGNFVLNIDGQEHVVEISTNDVIAFPASLMHTTQPNNSGHDRYVMATNVVWTENMRNRMAGKISGEQIDTLYTNRQSQLIRDLSQWHESNTTQVLN